MERVSRKITLWLQHVMDEVPAGTKISIIMRMRGDCIDVQKEEMVRIGLENVLVVHDVVCGTILKEKIDGLSNLEYVRQIDASKPVKMLK